jgi:hypothetical protein
MARVDGYMGPRWRTADARGRIFDSRFVASVGLKVSWTSGSEWLGDVCGLVLVLVLVGLRVGGFGAEDDLLVSGWRLRLGDAMVDGERWCGEVLFEYPLGVRTTCRRDVVSISLRSGS